MRADEQLLSQMNIQAASWESQEDKRFIFLRCYNLMGRVDEWLLSELISNWRSEVWEECGAMLKCESPENKESLRCTLEKRVMARAEGILHF